jgi:hypothetical protein
LKVNLCRYAAGRPYINVDIRPARKPVKVSMMAWTLHKSEGVDMRPALTLTRNATIEVGLHNCCTQLTDSLKATGLNPCDLLCDILVETKCFQWNNLWPLHGDPGHAHGGEG